jgi:hypothetical protein
MKNLIAFAGLSLLASSAHASLHHVRIDCDDDHGDAVEVSLSFATSGPVPTLEPAGEIQHLQSRRGPDGGTYGKIDRGELWPVYSPGMKTEGMETYAIVPRDSSFRFQGASKFYLRLSQRLLLEKATRGEGTLLELTPNSRKERALNCDLR